MAQRGQNGKFAIYNLIIRALNLIAFTRIRRTAPLFVILL